MTQKNNALPQLQNTVEIIGTLKSIDLEDKTSGNGNPYTRGNVTVVVNEDGKVHEHRVSVMVMASSKLHKGIKTVENEYRSIEKDGEELADRIQVTGEVELEEYYGKQDMELRSFNKVKGVFFNRLDADDEREDKAVASVEVVVKGFTPKTNDDGEIIHHQVNCFSVGYGEKIVEFKKAIIAEELAGPMEDLYEPGSTGRLTFKINNYAEKKEKEQQEQPVSMSHGFGSEEVPEVPKTFTNYVNNYEITGGDVPFEEPKAFTEEQIADAERKLALAREEAKERAESPAGNQPPQTNTGFGAGSKGGAPKAPKAPQTPKAPKAPTKPESSNPATGPVSDDVPDF